MHSICRLFKHTYFILLRSLQDISQLYIKCTENTLLIHDDNDNDSSVIIVVVINDDNDSNFKNKEKVQL